MDFSLIIYEALKNLWWFIIPMMLFLALRAFLRSPRFKGIHGEARVKFTAWLRLPSKTYHALHNVTLPTPDGTTQIDHVFVSCFGIFVVETKNMKGWIFGEENQKQWTQKFPKTSFKFQNPLRQNYKHIKALEALLDAPPAAIHSVVVFVGKSTFKSPMPANITHRGGYITYIKSFREAVLSDAQVQKAVTQIQSGRRTPSWETNRQHVRQLKSRFNPNTEKKCPKCGKPMVLRTAQRGANTGNQFWGCSAYPKCRIVQNIT